MNNSRTNFRFANRNNNVHNSSRSKRNTSGFKGVSFDRSRCKFLAEIMINCKKKHLGRFVDPIDAAKAYDTAAVKYFGNFAAVNFKEAA